MGWTLEGYNSVISAEQRRDTARQKLEIARRDCQPYAHWKPI